MNTDTPAQHEPRFDPEEPPMNPANYSPTSHQILDGKTASALPLDSVVLPVNWPDDGRGEMRPIRRVRRESYRQGSLDEVWTDDRTTSPELDPQGQFRVLYVPFPTAVAEGSRVERWMLDWFPTKTILRDADGWVVQLTNSESDERLWVGPLALGDDDLDGDHLWEESFRGGLYLVLHPSGSMLHPDNPVRPENQGPVE